MNPKEETLIKLVQECLCERYPASVSTFEVKRYLKNMYGLNYSQKQILKFLKRYVGLEWDCFKQGTSYHFWKMPDSFEFETHA